MPRQDMSKLSNDAHAWIFGITPSLDEAGRAKLLRRVDSFLDEWVAHGNPIDSARDVIEGTFLVIAADSRSERSGCSIDRLFGSLRQLEQELGVKILDANRIFFRHGDGRVDAMTRAEFREKGDAHTIVFDTTAETVGEIRNGGWERRAEFSWHRDLLRKSTAAANR